MPFPTRLPPHRVEGSLRPRSRVALFLSCVILAATTTALSASPGRADEDVRVRIPGLRAPASVVRDDDGVAHIKAQNAHDLFFLQGWVHADDRLFQMDVRRRRGRARSPSCSAAARCPAMSSCGRSGCGAPPSAACRCCRPRPRTDLRAYADGVNAWIARNKLPSQYAAVQVTKVAPWTVVDSLVVNKSLAFSLSFDLDIDRTTAVQRYSAAGLDGHTAVFQDVFPFAPFNTASPVIDSTATPASPGTRNTGLQRQHRRVGRRRAAGGRLPQEGRAGTADRRGDEPQRRARVELVGHRRAAHRERQADPGQRPAPDPGGPSTLQPDRPAGRRVQRSRATASRVRRT